MIVWDASSGKVVHKVACRTYPVALEWSPFSPTEICVAMRDKRSATPSRECTGAKRDLQGWVGVLVHVPCAWDEVGCGAV